MGEAPAGVIYDETETAEVDAANKPEIIGSVETNKGRVIESDDLLFYTDRRGAEAFTKLLIEGRISSPGLAKSRGEKFVDSHGERNDLMSSVNEPNSIYTSLSGPYWSGSCSLVFNAWDTLENFRFYDQGNTGLKLYDRDNDNTPAEFRFIDSENKTEAEFFILEPDYEQGGKMRQLFLGSTKGIMTPKEAGVWLDNHTVSTWEIKKAAWNNAEAILNGNPEYSEAIKKDLQHILNEVGSNKDPFIIRIQHRVSWLLENANNENLAEWFTFRIFGFDMLGQDHNSDIARFFRNEKSTDLYGSASMNPKKEISEPLTRLNQEFVGKMQDWLKQEFQRRYGLKTGRKAIVESKGPDNNKRLTLTIEKAATPSS